MRFGKRFRLVAWGWEFWGCFNTHVANSFDSDKVDFEYYADLDLQIRNELEFEAMIMDDRSLQTCNQQNKHKAIYSYFDFDPPLKDDPALDMIGDVFWDDIDDLRRHGKNGIFHAFPVGFGKNAPGGYLGPQATGRGDENVEQVLFSLWDNKRFGDEGWMPALPWLGGEIEDCEEFSAFSNPGKACCKRNCNDCREDQSTGTQCKVFIPAKSGMHLRMNVYRFLTDQSLDYEGKTWTGDVWQVDVYDMIARRRYPVGRQLLAGTSDSGIDRFSNFFEHIGCTPCDSFNQYTSRAGPWVLKSRSGGKTQLLSARSKFSNVNPPYICSNHAINSKMAPFIQISSGPSIPYLEGDGTWDKTLYTCPTDTCNPCDAPEDPKDMLTYCTDNPDNIFLGTKTCGWLALQKKSVQKNMCKMYASEICEATCNGVCHGCTDLASNKYTPQKGKKKTCAYMAKNIQSKEQYCQKNTESKTVCPDTCSGWCRCTDVLETTFSAGTSTKTCQWLQDQGKKYKKLCGKHQDAMTKCPDTCNGWC